MLKKLSSIPFNGTPEQEAQLKAIIAECKDDKSMLMHAMQEAQNIYGYLPIEVQKMIADGIGVPLQKVYGVATFYAQFALSPKGKYNISVCLGTACYVKGSQDILDKLKNSGLPVMDIHALLQLAHEITGVPEKKETSNTPVGVVVYRDGTVIDTVYQI